MDDPLAPSINSLADMQEKMPGALEAERDYLRFYKHTPNSFLFNGEPRDEVFAKRMIAETHEAWKSLVLGKVSGAATERDSTPSPRNFDEGSSSLRPASIISAGLTRSGSAGALAALVGAPHDATHVLLGGGGEGEDEKADFF